MLGEHVEDCEKGRAEPLNTTRRQRERQGYVCIIIHYREVMTLAEDLEDSWSLLVRILQQVG
jgi:hypothetical protein